MPNAYGRFPNVSVAKRKCKIANGACGIRENIQEKECLEITPVIVILSLEATHLRILFVWGASPGGNRHVGTHFEHLSSGGVKVNEPEYNEECPAQKGRQCREESPIVCPRCLNCDAEDDD